MNKDNHYIKELDNGYLIIYPDYMGKFWNYKTVLRRTGATDIIRFFDSFKSFCNYVKLLEPAGRN